MKKLRKFSATVVIVSGLLGSAFFYASSAAPPPIDTHAQPIPSLAPILEQVTSAVVNVSTRGHADAQNNPLLNDPFFRRFFNAPEQMPSQRQTQGLGSGVIVDAKKGYVLTNNHVIADADEVTVTLTDGRILKAKVVGADKETDVAVIQIPAEGLQQVALGDSTRLRVGDFVVAIGDPFGLGQTATSGIVSALGRSGLGIEGYEDFIQTDASINPGNSGGALIDLSGELIGINTAILAPGGGNIGIGFAIPINMARAVMDQLVEFGKVNRGQLGLQIQDLSPDLAQAFDIPAAGGIKGAVVTQVLPDSNAAKVGVKAGDVVTAIDGQPVRDASTLRNTVGLLPVGQKLRLDVLRGGSKKSFEVAIASVANQEAAGPSNDDPRLAGVTFGAIEKTSPLYGSIQGIPVIDVQRGTPAASAGLQANDVVVSVNNRQVNTPEEFVSASQANRETALLLNVQRGNGAFFIVIQPPAKG